MNIQFLKGLAGRQDFMIILFIPIVNWIASGNILIITMEIGQRIIFLRREKALPFLHNNIRYRKRQLTDVEKRHAFSLQHLRTFSLQTTIAIHHNKTKPYKRQQPSIIKKTKPCICRASFRWLVPFQFNFQPGQIARGNIKNQFLFFESVNKIVYASIFRFISI